MSTILAPSAGPESWRNLLAKPDVHWVTGRSARTVAHAWEAAAGLPPEVEAVCAAAYGPVELLLATPEHKTPLPGGRRDSQSDVFALLRRDSGLVALAVEGKVDEPFGPTVAQQMAAPTPGRTERLDYVCGLLGIADCPPDVHYQLLHRTAAALVEAERFHAADAAMVVHSFSPERRWFDAFARFAGLLGAEVAPDAPALVTVPGGRRLMLAWATGDQRFRVL